MTIENIKTACRRHYKASIGKYINDCDVLASDQGPCCKSIDQLPDTKVIYVRFIEAPAQSAQIDVDHEYTETAKRGIKRMRPDTSAESLPVTPTTSSKRSVVHYPKSVSLSTMLKLGKHITDTSTAIEIFSFNFEELSWPQHGESVEFTISKSPFSTGGFREAYDATSSSPKFPGKWVVKKYLPDTLSVIQNAMKETVETHTKKVVQMHHLARNMAARLDAMVVKNKEEDLYGERFCFNQIYWGKIGEEFVTVEKFIPGNFIKYMNNTGERCVEAGDDRGDKAECLCHFSYEKSERKLMVVDIQGSGFKLFDPEIASSNLFDNGKILFCAGNLSMEAIEKITNEHKCNTYCKLLGLNEL